MTDNAENVQNLKWLLDDERDSDTRAALTAAIAAIAAMSGDTVRVPRDVLDATLHDDYCPMCGYDGLWGCQRLSQREELLAGFITMLAAPPPKESE